MSEQQKPKERNKTHLPGATDFNEEKYTLLFDVDESLVDIEGCRKVAEEKELLLKNEFHFTVLGNSNGLIIKDFLETMSEEDKKVTIENLKLLEIGRAHV